MKMRVTFCLCALLLFYSERVFCSNQEQLLSIVKFKLEVIDKIIHYLLNLNESEPNFRNIPEYEFIPTSKLAAKSKDCSEIKENGITNSGIYEVWPLNGVGQLASFNVYCDMKTDGGGWLVFQRRGDFGHSKDYFYRNWKNYSQGFGNLDEDFWLGNDKLHQLTNQGKYSLRIDMKDKEGNSRYAQYQQFSIENENNYYKLHVSGYSGDAADSLINHHNGRYFSTFDKDNDEASGTSCSSYYKGAWWYNSCYDSNLNGMYWNGPYKTYADGVVWYNWKGLQYSLPSVEMKIRRN